MARVGSADVSPILPRRFFSQDVPDDCVLKDRLGQQRLASGMVAFQCVQSLGIQFSHPAKPAAPSTVRVIAAIMRAAQLRDRQAGIGVTQDADDLFFATPFLPVQSPSVATLDAKSTGDAPSG